jgi:signal transduction histidine kinase
VKNGVGRWCVGRIVRPRAGRLLTAFGVLAGVGWAVRQWGRPRRGVERHRRSDRQRLLGNERLAMVAHELRTPLSAIRHAAVALEGAGDARPEVRAACSIIRRQIEQAGRLVEDLLVRAGPEETRLGLGQEPLDLAVVLVEAVEALRGPVEERGHELSLTLPAGSLLIQGDADRLAQVVTNLVWNAAKFTPAGGHVGVTLTREAEEAVIRVRDDGIGIAPAMRDRIFRLFTRAAPPGDTGRGIGLTVVELIVARHGGRITVHSEGPGCGSEFIVRLPGAAEASRRTGEGQGSAKDIPGCRDRGRCIA